MINQAIIVSSTDTEVKYKISLAIGSRRLTLEALKIRIRKYMAAHHKKAGETSFIRNYDAVTITYAVAAAKKETPKKTEAKKETVKPLSRPAAKKPAKKPAAKTRIEYMASKRKYDDGEVYYVALNEDTEEYINHKGTFQKTFNSNTCAYSSRYYALEAIETHKEANK